MTAPKSTSEEGTEMGWTEIGCGLRVMVDEGMLIRMGWNVVTVSVVIVRVVIVSVVTWSVVDDVCEIDDCMGNVLV